MSEQQLTDADLAAIETQTLKAREWLADKRGLGNVAAKNIRADDVLSTDVPRLIAEIRRLQAAKIGQRDWKAEATAAHRANGELAQLCADGLGTLSLRTLQEEVQAWTSHNFPDAKPYQPLLGAVEEIGELAHAHLKAEQGIRGTGAEHQERKEDAIADAIIFLAHYCTLNGIDLQAAVARTWATVRQRDWQADPANGGTSPEGTDK